MFTAEFRTYVRFYRECDKSAKQLGLFLYSKLKLPITKIMVIWITFSVV